MSRAMGRSAQGPRILRNPVTGKEEETAGRFNALGVGRGEVIAGRTDGRRREESFGQRCQIETSTDATDELEISSREFSQVENKKSRGNILKGQMKGDGLYKTKANLWTGLGEEDK